MFQLGLFRESEKVALPQPFDTTIVCLYSVSQYSPPEQMPVLMRRFFPMAPMEDLSLSYLTDHPNRMIDVRFPDTMDLAFTEAASRLRPLIRRGMAQAALNRYGAVRHVLLSVPVAAARRAIRESSLPAAPRGTVTKPRSNRLDWPMRADRAKSAGMRRAMCGVHEMVWIGTRRRFG